MMNTAQAAGSWAAKRMDKEVSARFWSKVDIQGEDECWPWIAGLSQDGYGTFRHKYQQYRAHRFAWELVNGTIPNDEWKNTMHVLHTCDNRICCNPKHLFIGTHRDNMQDMIQKGRQNRSRPTMRRGKGYTWHMQHKKWMASIRVGGKRIYLGYFDTEEEAAQAYQEALKEVNE